MHKNYCVSTPGRKAPQIKVVLHEITTTKILKKIQKRLPNLTNVSDRKNNDCQQNDDDDDDERCVTLTQAYNSLTQKFRNPLITC